MNSNQNYRTAMTSIPTQHHQQIPQAQAGGQPQQAAGYAPNQVRNPRGPSPRYQTMPYAQPGQTFVMYTGPTGYYTLPAGHVPATQHMAQPTVGQGVAAYPQYPQIYSYPVRPTTPAQYQGYHGEVRPQQPHYQGVRMPPSYQVHQAHHIHSSGIQHQQQPSQPTTTQTAPQQIPMQPPHTQPTPHPTQPPIHYPPRVASGQGRESHNEREIPQASLNPPPVPAPKKEPRQKRILQIKDPTTGKNVLETPDTTDTTTGAPREEERSTEGAEASRASESDSTTPSKQDDSSVADNANSGTQVSQAPTGVDEKQTNDAKKEFFLKIAQTVDAPKSEESPAAAAPSTPETASEQEASKANGNDSGILVTTPDPTPTTTTPQPSPTVEEEKVEEEVTAAPEVAAPDAKTVKPTESSSPPPPEPEVSSSSTDEAVTPEAEACAKTEDEEVNQIAAKVQELALPNGENEKEEGSQNIEVPSSPDSHNLTAEPVSPTPMDEYCSPRSQNGSAGGDLTSSTNEDDNEEIMEKKDEKEVQEQNAVPGGASDGEDSEEDGEIRENGAQEGDEGEKKIRQYDREVLLRIGKELKSSKADVKIQVQEVIKDKAGNIAGPRGQMMNNANNRFAKGLGRGGQMSPMMHQGPFGHHRGPMDRIGGPLIWGPLTPPPPPPEGPRKIINITTKVKLHESENAWKPRVRAGQAEADMNDDEKQTENIVKQTRGILNKLTPENFSKLLEKFLKLELNDREDRISAVIKVVFEKAVDEPNFSMWYAKMVYEVCRKSQETSKKFRKEILDQCQREFQKSNKDEDEILQGEQAILEAAEDKKEALKAELEEKRFQMRRRSLGNVRFIGELYKLQMLTPKIMVDCVQMLLANADEESYECLCKLLTTVGEKLDTQLKEIENRAKELRAKGQPLPRFVPEQNYMDKTFAKLKALSNDHARLSSRIRFALLDLVELRDNDWKPRRDTNAPKTIEEVRREALRQDQEEKQKINLLPQEQGRRGGDSRMNQGPPGPAKKGDWSTVQSNKSSRFQTQLRRPTESSNTDRGSTPVLGPPQLGSVWSQQQSPAGRPYQPNSKSNLPPRLQAQAQQNSRFGPTPPITTPNRYSVLPETAGGPPPFMAPHRRSASPAPVSEKPAPKPQPEADEPLADINETVKNIFEEYLSVQKFEDTLDWIKNRFRGDKVYDFVDTLARQVAEMSKENQQVGAGKLIKMLIKQRVAHRDHVLKTITKGVIPDVPDIAIDSPKVTSYLAMFFVELFGDEGDLNWLVELTEPLDTEDFRGDRENLIQETLDLFKLKRNEQHVKSLWSNTNKKDSLVVESLPWLNGESRSSLVDKMIPVLKGNEPHEVVNVFKEKSWDLRESEISSAFILAICEVCYGDGAWNVEKLEKLVPLLSKTPGTPVPNLWKVAKEFIEQRKISKDGEQILWKQLMDSNVVTNKEC